MPFLFLKCLRGVSFLLLILSLPLHWFPVPVGLEERPIGVWKAVRAEPITTIWFKAVLIAILVMVFTVLWRRFKRGAPINWSGTMVSTGALIAALVLLLFPAMTIQRCVSISARATWLQMQHISLTWLGGDSFNAPEYAHKPLEADIDVKYLPRAFTILPPPPLSLADFRLAKFTEMLNWLGYTTAFCQLASAGWFCAAFGSILLVLVFFAKRKPRTVHRARLSGGVSSGARS